MLLSVVGAEQSVLFDLLSKTAHPCPSFVRVWTSGRTVPEPAAAPTDSDSV